jgi:hypothetical protein
MSSRYYRSTKVSFRRAAYLSLLGILAPQALADENEKDAKLLAPLLEGATPEPSPYVVCRAFWLSLVVVLGSMLAGYVLGQVSAQIFGCATSASFNALAILGAGVLLWGTLFVRGWQIQTIKGLSLTERVNQWLYRALYCVGTAVVIWSVSWPACKT